MPAVHRGCSTHGRCRPACAMWLCAARRQALGVQICTSRLMLSAHWLDADGWMDEYSQLIRSVHMHMTARRAERELRQRAQSIVLPMHNARWCTSKRGQSPPPLREGAPKAAARGWGPGAAQDKHNCIIIAAREGGGHACTAGEAACMMWPNARTHCWRARQLCSAGGSSEQPATRAVWYLQCIRSAQHALACMFWQQ